MMKIIIRPILLLFLLQLNNVICADDFSFGGYYKNFFAVYDNPRIETSAGSIDNPAMGMAISRLRIDTSYEIKNWLKFNASYSIAPRVQDNALFQSDFLPTDLNQFGYRAIDFDSRLYPSRGDSVGSFAIYQNLDRFFLGISAPAFDLYIGRQAIAWGSAHVINPTDILTPYRFEDLDTEERIGIDAVRLRVPLGMMSEFDTGIVAGDDFKYNTSAAFVRGRFYTMKTDISVIMIGFRENLLAGFDLASSVKGAGVWLETAYVWPDALADNDNSDSGDGYLRLSLGSDYSFGDKTYGFVEYHFNGAGESNPDNYLDLFSKTAYTDGAVYLLGKHYIIPGVSYQITPLITYTGQLLTNLNDPSAYFYSTIQYNFATNIYLSAGAYIGIGKNPELSLHLPISAKFESEFGSYPDIYVTSISIYF